MGNIIRNSLGITVLWILLMLIPAISNAEQDAIIIYGNHQCGLCQALMAELDENNMDYAFYDVRQNREHNREMWRKLSEEYPDIQRVGYPVVDVNGQIFIRPSLEEIRNNL